jgi:hypothetical protein
MKIFESIKSTLVHLISRKAATSGAESATQIRNHGHCGIGALLTLHVLGQPRSELLIQRSVFGTRAFPRSLNQTVVCTQCDVFHGDSRMGCTAGVYTESAHCGYA